MSKSSPVPGMKANPTNEADHTDRLPCMLRVAFDRTRAAGCTGMNPTISPETPHLYAAQSLCSTDHVSNGLFCVTCSSLVHRRAPPRQARTLPPRWQEHRASAVWFLRLPEGCKTRRFYLAFMRSICNSSGLKANHTLCTGAHTCMPWAGDPQVPSMRLECGRIDMLACIGTCCMMTG